MTVMMKFNGYDFSKKFLCLCDSRELPEFRDRSTEIEGADGEVFDGLTIGVREFQITLISKTRDPRELHMLARELTQNLCVSNPRAFTFSDEVDKEGYQLTRYAVPTGTPDVQDFIHAGKWTIRFKQPDPYLYGKKHEGVVLPASKYVKLSTGGNATTYPIAKTDTIPSGETLYSLARRNAQQIIFSAPFNGTVLTIDFAKQTVKASTALPSAPGLQLGSRFFGMNGDMELVASHRTTLEWTERWL